MKGVVVDVRATVAGERLRVGAKLSTKDGMVDALLPDREVAAFLPRSLLLGGGQGNPPRSLLASLTPILRRFTVGREVRVWSYEEACYFSFPSWRSVRFQAPDDGAPPEPSTADTAPDGHRAGVSAPGANATPA